FPPPAAAAPSPGGGGGDRGAPSIGPPPPYYQQPAAAALGPDATPPRRSCNFNPSFAPSVPELRERQIGGPPT
ncbi:MAG: hypothetical protein QGF33_12955, partial [Alphaproteobacteria bacterium]|nr:hypothetical protein [Alphaproteobacteria bacterium]